MVRPLRCCRICQTNYVPNINPIASFLCSQIITFIRTQNWLVQVYTYYRVSITIIFYYAISVYSRRNLVHRSTKNIAASVARRTSSRVTKFLLQNGRTSSVLPFPAGRDLPSRHRLVPRRTHDRSVQTRVSGKKLTSMLYAPETFTRHFITVTKLFCL